MRTQLGSALLAATLLFAAAPAQAHEFICRKTVDGQGYVEISQYPATVHYQVKVINTHPTATSTALRAEDKLFSALSFQTPFDVPVNGYKSKTYDLVISSYERCLELAELDGEDDKYIDNTFYVEWDRGCANCSAKVKCKPPYVPPNGEATRTMGFFKTHIEAIDACIDEGPVDLGFVTVDTTEEALGLLWANPAKYSPPDQSTRRSELDKARFLLARQTLVGICNVRLFGATPTPPDLLEDAVDALEGYDCELMRMLEPQVDAFNNSGDDEPFPSGFTPGPADPREARSLAVDPTSPSNDECANGAIGGM